MSDETPFHVDMRQRQAEFVSWSQRQKRRPLANPDERESKGCTHPADEPCFGKPAPVTEKETD